MRKIPPSSPLPPRDGVDAAKVRLPEGGSWATVRDFFAARLPRLSPASIDSLFEEGRYVNEDGCPLSLDSPFIPGHTVFFYRPLPEESDDASGVSIVYQDQRIVVVDKPHHVATMPRGSHVRQTALIQMRVELGEAALVPAHRLDRDTAGLLLMVRDPKCRGAYQGLFERRQVTKTYYAVAPIYEGGLPLTLRTHQIKQRGIHHAWEIPGVPPNAETTVELLDTHGDLGLYRLNPHTGRTHQLRLHMAHLGVPIVGDPLYPPGATIPSLHPLQLLACTLKFRDPVDGEIREFHSGRILAAWRGRWPHNVALTSEKSTQSPGPTGV